MNKIYTLLSFLFVISYSVNAQSDNKTTPVQVIKGTIKDEAGTAIPFASINIKDENGGTSTDSLGQFTLNAKLNSILVIGSVGFETTEVNISNKAVIIVLLKRTQQSMKEVSIAAKNNNINNNKKNSVDPTIEQQQTISAMLLNYTAASNIYPQPQPLFSGEVLVKNREKRHVLLIFPDPVKFIKDLLCLCLIRKMKLKEGSIYLRNGCMV